MSERGYEIVQTMFGSFQKAYCSTIAARYAEDGQKAGD
jgi:hypothetical protein